MLITELNLYQLYMEGYKFLECGGKVIDLSTEDTADYRLIINERHWIMNGEPCDIIDIDSSYVTIRTINDEYEYTFSRKEFEIAEGF